MTPVQAIFLFVIFPLLFTSCKTSAKTGGNSSTTQSQPATDTSASGNVITNKYWKLVEIMGKPVMADSQRAKEPHMILHTADNRITGNGSCNNFSGTYELSANNRISISPLAVTKMYCMDSMDIESQLLQALQQADGYSIKDDTLQLVRARMAPLARFVAVDSRK